MDRHITTCIKKSRLNRRGLLSEVVVGQFRICAPHAPDRIVIAPRLVQIQFPAMDHGRIQRALIGQQHKVFGARLIPLTMDGHQILDRSTPRSGDNPRSLFADERIEILQTLPNAFPKLSVGFGFRSGLKFGRQDRFDGTAKYAIQGVVVFLRNGIVLVVVASCTGDGQAHQAATDHIDAIVQNVVRIVHETRADGQESHGSKRPAIITQRQVIGSQLFHQKAVVRQIFVERADDVVAIRPGPGVAFLFEEHVSLVVGVAGHIQPITAPSFSVVWVFQQAVHQTRKRIKRPVGHECRDVLGSRRQTQQVEVGPPRERRFFGLGRKLQSGPLQSVHDKLVDGRSNLIRWFDRRRHGLDNRPERPMVCGGNLNLFRDRLAARCVARVDRPAPNPTLKIRNDGHVQFLAGRHFQGVMPQRIQNQTLAGFARHDGRPRVAPASRRVARIESQPAFDFVGRTRMTLVALGHEHRTNARLEEIDFIRRPTRRLQREQQQQARTTHKATLGHAGAPHGRVMRVRVLRV